MVQVPNNIIEIIKTFIEEAKKDNINISQEIQFGLYAKGTQHVWSNIDLALVTEDFNIENPFVREILKDEIRII